MYQPLSINIFENSLYWLMGSNGQLQKCKLYGDKSCEIMNIGRYNIHKYFSILHISIHPLGKYRMFKNGLSHTYKIIYFDGLLNFV